MSEAKRLPTREEVPEHLTWDLAKMFGSEEEYKKAFAGVEEKITALKDYQGTIQKGSDELLKAIEAMLNTSRDLETVYVYAHLKNDQDTSNSVYQELNDRARVLVTKYSEAISWFQPELLEIPEKTLAEMIQENEQLKMYEHMLERMTSKRDHVLSADKEAMLSAASDIFSASSQTFSVLNNADIEFPIVHDEEGNEVRLSHGLYGQLLESKDRDVRREAFKSLYSVYEGLQNTFASTLQGTIRYHNYNADVRAYDSARDAALSSNFIPESVYDALVEVVNEHLPVFHRYMGLRKRIMGLDELHMYDLYAPLADASEFEFTYEEAKEITLKALRPLGEEYQAILEEAFSDRWIDVVENKGKRSGAYSSGGYDTAPYILLNWHDSLNNLYTLVHELGHSLHSYLTQDAQPYVYGDYPIFLAEIASTTNENLLTSYLLEHTTDVNQRIVILNQYLDGMKGTVYRQTQFAEFEHFMHEELAKGNPLTSDFLSRNYAELNEKYYGEHVYQDEEIALEWSRIPHFYYNYYVYQYATGFCAATALADNILNKEDALESYLGYLKSGSSAYPIDVMKTAGVDMTQKAYLEQTFDIFEKRLDELEALLKEQEK